ncbi:MAG TPA: hypothetical protein VFS20_29160, partial [Longimicrobium sp.]|nr:hypothetical protein [Longimicrobium sp.]
EDLRVDSFATTDAEFARRGTVNAQSGFFSNGGPESCGFDQCVGYSSEAMVCDCDTTYTQRPPHCDPSEHTYCIGQTLCA